MIKIVTVSTSYIPREYLDEYGISIISLNVVLNNISRREVDISNETFYKEMNESNEIPTSTQPNPEEMLNLFDNIVKNGDSILAIFLSSDMSGTYSSAHLVKEMVLENYPNANIEILDSRTNCMQMGFIAIEAAKAAKEGKTMQEVKDIANNVINNSRFLFTPEVLDYLRKGGRIGGAAAIMGNLLQIKPILTVNDGKTTVFTKVRTKRKAINTIVDTLLEDISNKELGNVIVHHINCESDGVELANKLEEKLQRKVNLQSIGPVIGLHVGPGSIGIAYYTK